MLLSNRYVLAGATVVAAIGIGAIMQWGGLPEPLAERSGLPSEAEVAGNDAGPTGPGPRAPRPPEMDEAAGLSGITFTSAPPVPRDRVRPLPMPGLPEKAVAPKPDVAPEIGAPEPREEGAAPAPDCGVELAATPGEAAMVELALDAPCLPNERVTIHHNGMMVSAVTDTDGALEIEMPALAPAAVYIVAFDSGEGAVAQARVEDVEDRALVALQWREGAGISLHARANGAAYGEDGHVSATRPGTPGPDGFLTALGTAGAPGALRAEVFTLPAGVEPGDPSVDITVEAEVTEANCGKDLEAQLLVRRGGLLEARDIELYMPGCSAVGDFLVLKNPFEPLKLAGKN